VKHYETGQHGTVASYTNSFPRHVTHIQKE